MLAPFSSAFLGFLAEDLQYSLTPSSSAFSDFLSATWPYRADKSVRCDVSADDRTGRTSSAAAVAGSETAVVDWAAV